MSTPSSAPSSPASSLSFTVYKGKITHRSWQHLPPELIRLIVTHYLVDSSATSYCPQIWETRETWHNRMVYAIYRDTVHMEKLMCITPSWGTALEAHLFWYQACAVIDPTDCFAHHAIIRPTLPLNSGSTALAQPIRLTPYQHFRNLVNCSCAICRINNPHTSAGLATATQGKRPYPTPHVGPIPVCREHRRSAASFCGICLCSSSAIEMAIVENEDEDTWAGVEATCRACRNEGLWRRVRDSPRDREAVGLSKNGVWEREREVDWETRQAVDAFVEMGEGSITEVVVLAQEKHWLRNFTKLPDMLGQALAASRFGGAGGYDSEVAEEEEEEEDEDDPELMSLTEDAGGVRELAISDWARNRILDGLWHSPADQWYHYVVPGHPAVVRAVHPCPWNRDATYTGAMADDEDDGPEHLSHPRPSTVQTPTPPSFALCEQAYVAFQRQMRAIVLPALTNLVRKVVIECGAEGADPAVRAARMGMEEVLQALREEDGVWYNGIDWLERRANGEREERRRRAEDAREDDTSSSSSKSDGSHTTSPVLSTTTLQTTPSPSPTADKGEGPQVVVPIPISPVLDAPELLHPIPYVPMTTAGMPHYSMEAFKMVWREACAPLYHCRCKVCERAVVTANAAVGSVVPSQTQASRQVREAEEEGPKEIRIDEHEGEEEVDSSEVQTETTEETEEETEEEAEEMYRVTPRKRTSADRVAEDGDGEADADGEPDDGEEVAGGRGRTPPKRLRVAVVVEGRPKGLSSYRLDTTTHLRKRSSEEVEEGGDEHDGEALKKKARVGAEEGGSGGESPPTSLTETGPEDDSEDCAGRHSIKAPSVERDKLYTFETVAEQD